MSYILKGNNAEEIWQLNQVTKNHQLTKKQIIDFLDIQLDYKYINNSIMTFSFDITTQKDFTNYANLELNFWYLDIIYVYKGIARFSSQNIKNSLILKEKQWAIVSSEYANTIVFSQKENTNTKISHIVLTPQILAKFIELDNEISQLCQNIIEENSNKQIIAHGTADFNTQLIINEIESLQQKENNDKISNYLYTIKVEELFLTLLNETINSKSNQNRSLGSKIHQVILNQYQNISVKNISNILDISETTLRTTYKNEYNITPSQAIFKTKMYKAKLILKKDPTISLKQLSLEVGYKNAYRFSQEFKKFLLSNNINSI